MAILTILTRATRLTTRAISTQFRHHHTRTTTTTATFISAVKPMPSAMSTYFRGFGARCRLFSSNGGSTSSSYYETLLNSMLVMKAPSGLWKVKIRNNLPTLSVIFTKEFITGTIIVEVCPFQLVTAEEYKGDIVTVEIRPEICLIDEDGNVQESSSALNTPTMAPSPDKDGNAQESSSALNTPTMAPSPDKDDNVQESSSALSTPTVTPSLTGEEHKDQHSRFASKIPGVVKFLVSVEEKDGPSWKFHCSATPDKILINRLALKNPDNENELAYECSNFLDLGENLQKAFNKYLEIKEIKPIDMREFFLLVKGLMVRGELGYRIAS